MKTELEAIWAFTDLEAAYGEFYRIATADPYDHRPYAAADQRLNEAIREVYGDALFGYAREWIHDSYEVPPVYRVRERWLEDRRCELERDAANFVWAEDPDWVRECWTQLTAVLARIPAVDPDANLVMLRDAALMKAIREKIADYGCE